VTSITLGNAYQSNGKTVIGGSQSQIDTKALIDSLAAAKRAPADKLETTNKAIDGKTAAYTTLQGILTRFQTAADALRNPPGVANASANIFQYRTASVTSTGSNPAANYLAVTVEPGAANQNFTITSIGQLAAATKQDTNDVFTLADTTSQSVVTASGVHTAGLFAAGTFTLRNVTGGAPVSITLAEGDSLQSVVNKFNAMKDSTGIQANILKVATGTGTSDYKIVYTATKTGETYGFDLGAAGTVLTDTDGALSGINFHTSQPAKNATMTIDGVPIERESNSIDDLIAGVTFNLKATMTDGTKLNASIQPDTDIVKNAITSFADVYNEFRLFAAKQSEVGDDGVYLDTAVLANETEMRNMISQVSSVMTSVINGITGGEPERLADVGINFSNFAGDETNPATKNIITVDTDKLDSALNSDFTGVQELFEFTLDSDNPALTVFKRTNQLAVSNFQLVLDRTNNSYQAVYTDGTGTHTIDVDATALGTGLSISGKKGTVLDGLQLIFASPATSATINVNISQGFGDQVYNLMDNVLNTTDGTLTRVMKSFADQKSRNTAEITKIDDRIVAYRDQLTNQYATLEAALTKANNLIALLDAQSAARQASSS
jgi:flagellar hook-associated protein 2